MKLEDTGRGRRRHRPRSHQRSRAHSALRRRAGRLRFRIQRSPDRRRRHQAARIAAARRRLSMPRSKAMPCCSAPSAATNSIPFRPIAAPKPACCRLRQALGGFANLRPAFAWPSLCRRTRRSSPKSSTAPTSSSCASCSAASTSASRASGTAKRLRLEHHALHPRRSRPRRARRF